MPLHGKKLTEDSTVQLQAERIGRLQQGGSVYTVRDKCATPATVLGPHGRIVSIRFCAPGQLRIRPVVMRSRFRVTIKYPSIKAKRMVQCEARNERNLCSLMECDPDIVSYEEQPCEIVYLDGGKEHYHYPDFLVRSEHCKSLVEVKEARDAAEHQQRTDLLKRELPYFGYSYEVRIAEELKLQPRLGIADKIVRFGRRPISTLEREFVRRTLLSATSALTWGQACSGEFGLYGRELLCRLVLEGVLCVDFESPFSEMTAFVLRKGAM